jgi:long-chain acyl-CoA synthetase
MNLADALARAARTYPENPAVYLGSELLYDYRTLADRTARLAGGLRSQLELQPGDRVAILMHNRPEYLETFYAIWWAGLVAVPINAKLHPKEVAYILRNSKAAALVVDEGLGGPLMPHIPTEIGNERVIAPGSSTYNDLAKSAPQGPEPREPVDLAWIFYTSGTTGMPKGVMLTHRNLYTMASCYHIDVDHVTSSDATIYAAPMSHGAGLYSIVFTLKGARHVYPASQGFDCAELFALAAALPGLSMFAAPTMVNRLVRHAAEAGADSSGFKTIVYGGGPMYAADIKKALSIMGNRFVQIYGQGESPMTITALSREHLSAREHPDWERRIASVGVAQALVEVRIADTNGLPLPAGDLGEVLVRGDVVMAGYWDNPEASAGTLRDNWLWTGDIGVLDDHGFLTLKDRSKDVIISGGTNIYPREVEEVLLKFPGVTEACVIGKPDDEWGEIVVAYIVTHPDRAIRESDLDAFCMEQIARFKRPKEYHFLQALPKNHYGKVLKTELRAKAGASNRLS